MPEPEDWQTLPCGCKMGKVENIFVFEPHSLTCEYYIFVLDEAARRNIPTSTVEL